MDLVTIYNTELYPSDLRPASNAQVVIRLISNGGFVNELDAQIAGETRLLANGNGYWEVDQVPSSEIDDGTSYYEVDIHLEGENILTYTYRVPDSGGPYELGSVLYVVPAPLEAPINHAVTHAPGAGDSLEDWYGSSEVAVEEHPPIVFVSRSTVTPSSTDVDVDRGSRSKPYDTLEKVFLELTGVDTPGNNVFADQPVDIRMLPGPEEEFALIPDGGYPTGTTFGGQAQRLTQTWALPDGTSLQGARGLNPKDDDPVDGSHKKTFVNLVYGEIADEALIEIGASSGHPSGSGVLLEKFCVSNLLGHGVQVWKAIATTRIDRVTAWACYQSAFRLSKHGMDALQLERCMSRYAGTSGVGFGLEMEPAATGMPNLVIIRECDFRRNGVVFTPLTGNLTVSGGSTSVTLTSGAFDTSAGEAHIAIDGAGPGGAVYHGMLRTYADSTHGTIDPAVSTGVTAQPFSLFTRHSGEVMVHNESDSGSSGLGWVFENCRIGYNGFNIFGAKGGRIVGGYVEGSGSIEVGPGILIDAYGPGGIGDRSDVVYLARAITIEDVYLHGFCPVIPDHWGGQVHVNGARDIRVKDNAHVANNATARPFVWFDDDGARVCYCRIKSPLSEGHAEQPTGTAGENSCHIGHASNYGEYLDVGLGTAEKWGSVF